MSADNNSDNDDLTTDAVPSPPRDEINNKGTTSTSQEDNSEKVNAHPRIPNVHKIPKSKGFTKTKKSTPTAFASVINITNGSGIHIGSNYIMNFNKTDNTQKNKEYIPTPAIKSLFTSTESVTRKHLLFISPHINNEDWRTTARRLNFSDGQISQFYEDYIRSGIKEVIFQLLLDWTQNEGASATVGKLSNALWETNQQDAVTRWSKHFNTSSSE